MHQKVAEQYLSNLENTNGFPIEITITKRDNTKYVFTRSELNENHKSIIENMKRVYKARTKHQKVQLTLEDSDHFGRELYGELRKQCLCDIFNVFLQNCGMNGDSTFLDLGSGLGAPCLMARMATSNVYGIERNESFLHHSRTTAETLNCEVTFIKGDIAKEDNWPEMITHVYAFDFVYQENDKNDVLRILETKRVPYFATTIRYKDIPDTMNPYIKGVVQSFMMGSGQPIQFYVYHFRY